MTKELFSRIEQNILGAMLNGTVVLSVFDFVKTVFWKDRWGGGCQNQGKKVVFWLKRFVFGVKTINLAHVL